MRRLLCVLAVGLFAACLPLGPGPASRTVGGECDADRDCDDECVESADFGGGMCTVECDSDRDCPGGTRCVNKSDGICAVECDVDRDCDGFAQDFECKRTDRRGEGGDVEVCRKG